MNWRTAQVFEVSVIVNNSPILDYIHPDDHAEQDSINSVLVKVILGLFHLNKLFLFSFLLKC